MASSNCSTIIKIAIFCLVSFSVFYLVMFNDIRENPRYSSTNNNSNSNVRERTLLKGHIYETVIKDTSVYGQYLVLNTSERLNPESPPVLASVTGGLGNQLFELACVYSVAKRRNSNAYIYSPPKGVYKENHRHPDRGRPFTLDHFKIPFVAYSNDTFEDYKNGSIFKFKEQHIWENKLPSDQVLRLMDVCVSEYYFKEFRDEIKEMLQLDIDETPIQDILTQIVRAESVSVHVRRGDYTSKNDNRTLPITFQKRAMKWMLRMVANATFFVFSDDLKYVKNELNDFPNIVYVDNSKKNLASLFDFLLMSRCKHNIIANSTFSWWAAYLNRNDDKIVIGPMPRHRPGWNENQYRDKNFFKYRELVLHNYLYPTEWLTFNPFEY